MRIGGFQPVSLIDYPGTMSAVVFTVGCNFRCPYCHNPELVFETPERIIPKEEILSHLRARAGVLPAVTTTGGEPTIHEDLQDFLRAVKKLGFMLKLDTNGTNPAMLRSLIREGLLDYVAMDVKAPLRRYPEVVGSVVNTSAITESIALLRENAVEYEFRTTIVRSQLLPEDLLEIGREIKGARRYFLQQFIPAKTLHPSFRSKLSYTRSELESFAKALSPYVEHCSIRA